MIFTIYGLRERDSTEIRYIGFTRFTPAERLHRHSTDSSYGTPGRPDRQWVLANYENIEPVTICIAHTEIEARAMEKAAIAACAHTGQRLFNSDHMPRPIIARARQTGAAA